MSTGQRVSVSQNLILLFYIIFHHLWTNATVKSVLRAERKETIYM